jgi:hypothetical protein
MLYAFAFERLGVVLGDLYFLDPRPTPGQEGAERGVRLELRIFDRLPLTGSVYAAQPIAVGQPVWRADLLESVSGPFASFDRTHHHPRFVGWEPGSRVFEEALSTDPVQWVGERLRNADELLAAVDLQSGDVSVEDVADLRDAVPEILETLRRLLARVHSGDLGRAPDVADATCVRSGWL